MGNFKSKKITPLKYVKLFDENRKLKNKCKKLENKIKKLEKIPDFECCVCYSKDHIKQKKIRCEHQICKRCYKLITDKKCPICRKKMIAKSKYYIQK